MNAPATGLLGRRRQIAALDRLLRDVREGGSRTLVLRGEAGSGKTALLDHLAGEAAGCRVVRAAGVESETEIAYSALQLLCAPLLDHLDRLPGPQRQALATAFGLSAGESPAELVVGLAALGLFAEAAASHSLICLVDDAQWLDPASATILSFVARRLEAESVALVFTARDQETLAGLPELQVDGLPAVDARALLDSVLTGPVDSAVRDRIVAETRGNPLALLELPRGMSPAELAFGLGAPSVASVPGRVEDDFRRRAAQLPPPARTVLLAAAVEPVGNEPLLRRVLEKLGIAPDAAEAAEASGLIELGTRVRFLHPLVRSAVWRSAPPADLRAVHGALAEVTDPGQDPDRHAWHRAHAAAGPDPEVADELERSAGRARARGGQAAAAAFLERAAELTVDPQQRASLLLAAGRERLEAGTPAHVPDLLSAVEMGPVDPLQRAQVERLRAQVALILKPGSTACAPLLEAARRLAELDPAAARETYLLAMGAGLHAGRFGGDTLRRAADAARRLPPGDDFGGLLLTGLAAWVLDGYAESVPLLQRALDAMNAERDLGLLWVAVPVGIEVFRNITTDPLSEDAVRAARATGSLSRLPAALGFRAGTLTVLGRFADAAAMVDEGESLARASGVAFPASSSINLAAHRGRKEEALDLIEASVRDSRERGEGVRLAHAGYAKAVLYNGLADYPAAMAAALEVTEHPDIGMGREALTELVEAAVRAGAPQVAADARQRLTRWTSAVDSDWPRGIQAVADALTGPRDQADRHYRTAIDAFTRIRRPVLASRASLLYGEWLRREGRRGEARTRLREAYEAFTAMGAEAFATRAGRELVAGGGTLRTRESPSPAELTSQEFHIARLAVAGRTNPEIGAELFLSPRTVEWHLRKIFAKLGVTSRRELPGALREKTA